MTGNPLLREEIAKLHGVYKDNVLVVVPQEGIYIAMKCLVNYLKGYVFALNKLLRLLIKKYIYKLYVPNKTNIWFR